MSLHSQPSAPDRLCTSALVSRLAALAPQPAASSKIVYVGLGFEARCARTSTSGELTDCVRRPWFRGSLRSHRNQRRAHRLCPSALVSRLAALAPQPAASSQIVAHEPDPAAPVRSADPAAR